jgi:hypothetical protein
MSGACCSERTIDQGALRRLLSIGQEVKTEQSVTLLVLDVGANHGARQRPWRSMYGRDGRELRC